MKRSDFLKSLGLSAGGIILPKNSFVQHQPTKIYDNYIKGLTHYDYQRIQKEIKEGDELMLQREKDNVHDTYAIAIYFQQYKLGYISAYENIVLANMLDNGVVLQAFASQIQRHSAIYKAVAIEIFAQLILPSKKLIELVTIENRADDANDLYRQGY